MTREQELREVELPIKEMKLAGYDILGPQELEAEHNWVHSATVAWCRKDGKSLFLYYFASPEQARGAIDRPGWYIGDPVQPTTLDDAIPQMRDWFEGDE